MTVCFLYKGDFRLCVKVNINVKGYPSTQFQFLQTTIKSNLYLHILACQLRMSITQSEKFLSIYFKFFTFYDTKSVMNNTI